MDCNRECLLLTYGWEFRRNGQCDRTFLDRSLFRDHGAQRNPHHRRTNRNGNSDSEIRHWQTGYSAAPPTDTIKAGTSLSSDAAGNIYFAGSSSIQMWTKSANAVTTFVNAADLNISSLTVSAFGVDANGSTAYVLNSADGYYLEYSNGSRWPQQPHLRGAQPSGWPGFFPGFRYGSRSYFGYRLCGFPDRGSHWRRSRMGRRSTHLCIPTH